MSPLFLIPLLLMIVLAHIGIVLYAALRMTNQRERLPWLAGMVTLSAVAIGVFMLIAPDGVVANKIGRGVWLMLALGALLGLFGALVIVDLSQPSQRRRLLTGWGALMAVWATLLLLAVLTTPGVAIPRSIWVANPTATDFAALVAIIGFALSGLVLIGLGFSFFYQARLPESANRALFWVLAGAALLTGIVLISSNDRLLTLLGITVQTIVLAGAAYACVQHRVFDIRGNLSQTLTLLLLTVLTAALLFGTLYAVTGLNLNARRDGLSVIAGLALLVALLYIPMRRLLEVLIDRLFNVRLVDPSQATREFNRRVAHAVELDDLAQLASLTLNRVLGVRRSGLILVNSSAQDSLELMLIPGGSFGAETKDKTVSIPVGSMFYRAIAADHRAVTQFDLEYDAQYADVGEPALGFFKQLQMSAYAPIIMDNIMMGLLVAGPKLTDAAYTQGDIQLLMTLAQQTGFALRNARLVSDLQHLNATMRALNRGLGDANSELAQLDSVKTDFVTIASHELRTPLAQIRGYTDIIDTINEQGMLDQSQTTVLVTNLRKATERMEELIAAMLDVSQLDVDAMDLRFAPTT
ncbi:MAG: hypothetical protein H7Y11_03290, partial [Armatimonadetes bacterium]|nr:hypothetical protein [Anaerolineae bacterium]